MTLLVMLAFLASGPSLDASLKRVPEREAEWRKTLRSLPKAERPGAEYLLTYMPYWDLKALPVARLKEAVDLSYGIRTKLSWGKNVPDDVFFDSVLPYASVTEPRQSLRAEFQKKYFPLVQATKTPGEAALLVNGILFKDYKVTYNTKRLRTDQCAPESIAQGMATCTGLSIMLVDALRAVGVPARVAGIPSWPGRGGNHTWVEVWDKGDWHFVGAAEPDPAGLDHAWFGDEAGGAIAEQPLNSVYAVTYKDTGTYFPMVWEPDTKVPAENVTARYAKKLHEKSPRLMVEVKQGGSRVMADVIALNAATGDKCMIGKSKGPESDMNLHLSAPASQAGDYLITATFDGKTSTSLAKVNGDTVVRIDLDHPSADALNPILSDRFGHDAAAASKASKILAQIPYSKGLEGVAWKAYLNSSDSELKKQFDAKTVSTSDRTSPYLWRTVGTKPKDGWGLVIAMHGGGGAPKAVNDGEWNGMFNTYYRDHPEGTGYVYLALRAPNDEWNGFYDDSISPLVEKLIWQFVKYAEVDPQRVSICGASHGGYGTFVIAPKIPYRFAAAHAAASAPTDGETRGVNLRNLRFTWAVGETDTAYGRNERCHAFENLWTGWKSQFGGFDGALQVVPGRGHLINGFERDQVAELVKSTRISSPTRVIWDQSDSVLHNFYWLEAATPVNGGRIDAAISGNTVSLTTLKQGDVSLLLRPEMVDYSKPITVIRDGKSITVTAQASMEAFAEILIKTNDPFLAAPLKIVVH